MPYQLSEEQLENTPIFYAKDKEHSKFLVRQINGEKYLFKFFLDTEEKVKQKLRIIHQFPKDDYPLPNAFPISTFLIQNQELGYISPYYDDAINGEERLEENIDYHLLLQAATDADNQLRYIHSQGFIFNDIRLTNMIVSQEEGHGFLVDFENMIFMKEYCYKRSRYRISDQFELKVLPPSQSEDTKKLFICICSLMFKKNFEEFVINNDVEDFIDILRIDNRLYQYGKEVFYREEPIYFEEIKNLFQDEEKIKSYQKKIRIR